MAGKKARQQEREAAGHLPFIKFRPRVREIVPTFREDLLSLLNLPEHVFAGMPKGSCPRCFH